MPDIPQVLEAVKQAKQMDMTSSDWWRMAAAFIFGGSTSALVVLRGGKNPTWKQVVSTSLLSGAIAMMFIAFFSPIYGIPMQWAIGLGILVGIGGEVAIRGVVASSPRILGAILSVFGYSKNKSNDK